MALTFGSLFAGIGGFDLGFERAGMKGRWQVEVNAFCVSVLERHWPTVQRFRDIRDFYPTSQQRVDVICGGFPCQDLSSANASGKGLDGERSGLWSEYFRVIRTLQPRYVVVENVANLLRRGHGRVLGDLASIGYDAEWQSFFASDFRLPHRRERVCIIAYPNSFVRSECEGVGLISDWETEVFGTTGDKRSKVRVQTFDHLIGVDDGLTRESYGPRAEAVGNSVCPAACEYWARLIIEHDKRFGRDTKKQLT